MGLKMTWGCNMVVSVMDADLLKLMWQAGCRELWLGVESGSPHILHDMNKPFNLRDIREAFKITKDLGFTRRAYILLGMPEETREDIEMTDRLIEEIEPDIVGFTILAPFPGTAFYNKDVHTHIDWSEVDEYHNQFTRTKTLSNEELHQIQKNFVNKYRHKIAFHHKLYEKSG
jgi:anaerobic magnesium-protoporphyrin IX monomethyl ester cyclase